MLLFRSEEEIRAWCARRGRPLGAVVPVARLQRLARDWYGDRLDAAWCPRTPLQSQALLAAAGLTGGFWRLGP